MFRYIDKLSSKQRAFIFIFTDIVISILVLLLAFFLRFGLTNLALSFIRQYWWYIPIFVGIRIGIFQNVGIYTFLWRYASLKELVAVVKAITVSSLFIMAFLFITNKQHHFPASIILIDWALTIIAIGTTRVLIRLLKDYYHKKNLFLSKKKSNTDQKTKNLIIIGAGDAGDMIARELLKSTKSDYHIIGFVDDNENKIGQNIHQLPVLGTTKDLIRLVPEYHIQEAIIAMPSAKGRQIRAIVQICEQANIQFKITPALYDIIHGKVSINQLREVRIDDLLGRDVINTDISGISAYLSKKIVLVTGGGGSIGAELCRQILKFSPKQLILLDQSANHVYQIDLELSQLPIENTQIIPLVGDVKNTKRLHEIFSQYHPQIIFHAAAYKHVPLMESNVSEAIFNNIGGTQQLLEMADVFKVQKCVLISTDKAVNPANCMGATKRISEILMQIKAQESKTIFTAVRFGNVLDSEGSVVPLFRQQIAKGGPVTVTHPEITRFFMTISEAVRLVIQAGAFAEGGEIFVLDMGEPVKIVDLAKDMIRLSGFKIGRDIEIKYIGLRPGEKLYEELFYSNENLKSTEHKKILISKPTCYNKEKVLKSIFKLLEDSPKTVEALLKKQLLELVKKL